MLAAIRGPDVVTEIEPVPEFSATMPVLAVSVTAPALMVTPAPAPELLLAKMAASPEWLP